MPFHPSLRAALCCASSIRTIALCLIAGAAATAWAAAGNDYQNLFTVSGATPKALYQSSAVTLSDGRVLMLGGSAEQPANGSPASVASCAIYNPLSGTWAPTGAMISARRGGGACLLADGEVMVAGGYDVNGGTLIVLSAAELFSPANGSWSALPALPVGLRLASLILLPNGTLLALGTSAGGAIAGAAYHPVAGSWSVIAPTLLVRNACAFALLPSGLVLAAGGNALSGAPGAYTATPTTSCELYDPVANAWSPTGALLSNHLSCQCLTLPSGAVLIGAGSGGSGAYGNTGAADSELYRAGSWTSTGQLPYQATTAAVCLLTSGDVLSAGGVSGNWITSAARYSSATGSWSTAFAMTSSHYTGALAALPGDQAVIMDGWDEIAGLQGTVTYASDGSSEVYQDALINSAPSFSCGPDQAVLENSGLHTVPGWASAIVAGPPADSALTVAFLVSSSAPALFSVPPAVDASGTLTYTLAANAIGTATVTIQAQNDGGTAHGGQDTSPAQTFTIAVAFVNVPPTFTIGSNQSVLRTAGAQSVAGFLTAVSPGPANESSFTVQVGVANTANQLFAVQPAIDALGTLTYTPGDSAGGVASVAVTVTNSGGTADGGVAATTRTFTITIIPVNHVPFFTVGPAVAIAEDSPAVTIPGWATGISPGIFDAGQTVTFAVTTTTTALFAVQPAIDPSGTLTFTPAANALGAAAITVVLHDDGGTANGGSDTSPPQTATITLTSVPTLTIAPNAISTSASPIDVTFTFSEAVNGFAAGAIAVTNGTLGAFSGAGSIYSCAITPLADGPLTVSVAAGACASVADGNGNAAATATITSDRTPPTVVIAPDAILTNAASVRFTFTFSKPVVGFSASSVQLINGSAGLFLGSGASYSLSVSPQAVGTVTVAVPAGACSDAVGNGVIASAASISFDDTSPTAVIAPSGGATDVAPITFTITFATPVSGLTAAAFTASNGTVGALSGSGASYRLPVTPTRQGAIGLALAANAASDAFGNGTLAASASELYDTSAPSLSISPSGTRTNASAILFAFTFSEPVTGFSAALVTIANGVAGPFTGSGSAYTLLVTAASQGAVQVSVPAGACSDAAGNGNLAGSGSVIYDTTAPVLTISPTAITTNASPIIFAISASKPITGLSAASFSCVDGTPGLLSGSGTAYTLPVTPLGNGSVTLALPAGSVSDLAGNPNAPASATVISDTTPPSVAISPGSGSSNADPLVFAITFSAAVSGVTTRSITVGNGTLGTLSGSGASYSLTVVPTAQGAVTLGIGAGAGTDAAGNASLAAAATIIYDTSPPTAVISAGGTPTAAGIITDASPITFTIGWDKAVSGMSAGALIAVDGTLGTLSGTGAAYAVTVSPLADGVVSLTIPAGTVVDAAGNRNAQAFSATVTSQRTPPTVSLSPDGISTNRTPTVLTLTFSEAITGLSAAGIAVSNGTLGALSGSGATYQLPVYPTANGSVGITVVEGAGHDAAGNLSLAAMASFIYDTVPPACTITPAGMVTNANLVTLTVTFSAPVTGFTANEVRVVNGTVGAVASASSAAGASAAYDVAIAPSADGLVTVAIAAGAGVDAAGNPSTPATASFTSLRTPPTVAITPSGTTTNASPIIVTFTFSTPPVGFGPSAVTLTNATAGAFSGSGTIFTFAVDPIADGPVVVALAAGAVSDAAGNGVIASAATITSRRQLPTPVITPASGATAASPIGFTITFPEPVSGFSAALLQLVNGSAGTASGSGAVYAVAVTPGVQGPVTVTLPAGAVSDAYGNANLAASATVSYETTAPGLAITPDGQLLTSPTIVFTFTFSQIVTGFSAGAITIANGTPGAFSGTGASYSLVVTPLAAGPVSLAVGVGAAVDAAGIGNTAATATVTFGPVNQPPQWTPGGNVTVAENSPAYTAIGWATGISAGPASQSGETVSVGLTTSAPALFSVQPMITPDGTLTFTPATDQYGQAQLTAVLGNSGGTANGGSDEAAPVTFLITITHVLQPPTATTLILHSVLGVPVSGQIVLSDPDHQLPAGAPAYALTGIAQLGALSVSPSGLVTFTPTQAGNQQIPYAATVAGAVYPGVIQLYDNALVAGRPLIASIPSREQGASGAPWSYALTVDPLSISAGDQLTVSVQSPDAALNAATVSPSSGNQFQIAVPALDAAGGPLQSLTVIVTDATTNQSDLEVIFVVVAAPGGPA